MVWVRQRYELSETTDYESYLNIVLIALNTNLV